LANIKEKSEMKRIILTITILILIFGSCTNNNKSELGIVSRNKKNENKTVEKKAELNTEIIKEYILQKWISKTIEYNDKSLTFYSFKEPKIKASDEFLIEFKENGELDLRNTTKSYECANGIPYLDKATWEFQKGLYKPETNDYHLTNNLILHIKGGKLAENRFEFKREYKIKSISENKIELIQVHSILEKFITDGNNFYTE
tara:strand:+ start:5397 stop:6002 length:606 start_codon:yes stop_codon:yes gene_type:complete